MPIFDIVSPLNNDKRPLYQFGHTSQALDCQFDLLLEFSKHAEFYFSKVVFIATLFTN